MTRKDLEKGKKYCVTLDAVSVDIEVLSIEEIAGTKYYKLIVDNVRDDEIW